MSNNLIPARRAMPLAEKIVARLESGCDRIEVAGALRRRTQWVGDIDIVATAKIGTVPGSGLFEEQGPLLNPILHELVKDRKLTPLAVGPKLKRYTIEAVSPPLTLDLFLVDPRAWGMQLAIRTGPADYARHLVTVRSKGGALADGYRVRDGLVYEELPPTDADYGREDLPHITCIDGLPYLVHPVPEETDFFKLIKGGWVDPIARRYR